MESGETLNLRDVLASDELEDESRDVDKCLIIVILTDREVHKLSNETVQLNLNGSLDKEVLLGVLITHNLLTLIKVYILEVIDHQGRDLFEEDESSHGSPIELTSDISIVEEFLHKFEQSRHYLNISKETLKSLLYNLEMCRIEPLKEKGVHPWLTESLRNSHDTGTQSEELLSRLLDCTLL